MSVCDRLIKQIGTADVSHHIPKNATKKQCAGYLKEYIVDRQHFRYDYYMKMLHYYFRQYLDIRGGGYKPLIIHVDLGTGQGIFNWVVHDFVQQNWNQANRPKLTQFGYDHCPAMVKLAKQIWRDFGLPDKVQYTDSRKALRKSVGTATGDAYLLITFGYVLIQSNNLIDRTVMSNFAKLCNRLALDRNAVDVLAVDAYAYDWSQQFDNAAERLHRELCYPRTDTAASYPWHRVSIPPDVLSLESKAIMSIRRSQ